MSFRCNFWHIIVAIVCSMYSVAAQVTVSSVDTDAVEKVVSYADNNVTFTIGTKSPSGFSLIMEEGKSIEMDFTLFCHSKNDNFYLKMESTDTGIFTIVSESYVHLSCENASEIDPGSMKNATNDFGYQTDTSDKIYNKHLVTNGSFEVDFYGVIVGGAKLLFFLHRSNVTTTVISNISNVDDVIISEHQMTVFRRIRPVDTIFRVVIYFFLIFVTLAFGCKLDLEVVKESLKKPIAPGIGLACQYILMPLIGYGIAKVVTQHAPSVSLGIFVCGCCPGGGASNIYSHLLNGDLSLSITMTAVSTVAALGMLPLWLYTLGKEFIDEAANVSVPFVNIITTLLILIIPLFVGLLIKYKFPKIRKIFLKIVTPVTVVAVIVLLTVGIYSNLFIFKLFKPRIVLAGCLLPYIGYVIGGAISGILRQPWERVKTIAIETGMQNTGIAIVLMMVAFPPPYGEIAAVAPIASGIMTPLPLFLITIVYLIYKRCNKDKYAKVPVENGVKKENDSEEEKSDKKENNTELTNVIDEKLSTV